MVFLHDIVESFSSVINVAFVISWNTVEPLLYDHPQNHIDVVV